MFPLVRLYLLLVLTLHLLVARAADKTTATAEKTGREGKIKINDNGIIQSSPSETPQKVLLISVDGYRWDFHRLFDTPHIARLLRNGVTVDHVLNVFPTKTLPNHQSIVTGLYPGNHGMVDNAFMDKATGLRFDLDDPKCLSENATSWWNQSLPLWIEVEQKTKYKSGNMFWPGYKVPYGKHHNRTSTYMPPRELRNEYEKLTGEELNTTMYKVLDQAFNWLAQDDVIFVAMYSLEPDLTLHENGVENVKVKKQVNDLDKFVGAIYESVMHNRMLKDTVNVIFVGKVVFIPF